MTEFDTTIKLPIIDYLKIFNFLSKVIYYSTLGNPYSRNTNPLGPLRKECCTDLIKNDINLCKIADIIDKDPSIDITKMKYVDMFTDKISDGFIISIVTYECSDDDIEEYASVYCTNVIFEDDDRHLYVLIDTRVFDAGTTINNQKYLSRMLHSIIEKLTFSYNGSRDIDISMSYLNNLLSHLLYTNNENIESEDYMHKINITIDKIVGKVTDDNRDYLAFNLDKKEDIRDLFHEFVDLVKEY